MYSSILFFFNDTATTEIYTLSLHDALPIWSGSTTTDSEQAGRGGSSKRDLLAAGPRSGAVQEGLGWVRPVLDRDRKSTRLNSSHANISYARLCFKKKKKKSHSQICIWCYSC